MNDFPKVNTVEALENLQGKPVPVAAFAFMAGRHRHSIYQRIQRGTLPACYLAGQLCVLVNGDSPDGQLVPPLPCPKSAIF